MTYKRDRRFRRFLERFGEATSHQPVPPASIEKYRGKLPDLLLSYWQHEGWNGYDNGLIWTVNPDDYADTLEDWLAPTPLPDIDDYHVFARTAFGKLFAFGSKNGRTCTISPYWNAIFTKKSWANSKNQDWDNTISTFFGFATKEEYDIEDINGKPLFQRTLKRLGPCDVDEVYGFVPALVMGGEEIEANLQKMNIFIHLDILSQMSDERSLPMWNMP